MHLQKRHKLPHLFLFGSGRSGTTLLASILNASQQVFIPYESYFLTSAYPTYHNKTEFDMADYRQISKLFRKMTKRSWDMTEDYLVSALVRESPQSFSEVNAVICKAFHHKENTENLKWGIKAPVLIARLDRVRAVCPQSKLVHIVRDGRDVCLSYQRIHETSKVKFGPKSVIENALYWVDGLRRVEDFLNERGDKQIHELRYEDLLFEPTTVLSQLCHYLDIDYAAKMHASFGAFSKNEKVVPNHFRKSFHQNLQSGLDISNVNKYRTRMSTRQRLLFELIAIPYLIKYGYAIEYPFLSWPLFLPLRSVVYFVARQFNNWRYSKRDKQLNEL